MRVNGINSQMTAFKDARFSNDDKTNFSRDWLKSNDAINKQLDDMIDYLDKSSNIAKADVLVKLDFDYISGMTVIEGEVRGKNGLRRPMLISEQSSEHAFKRNIEAFETAVEESY